MVFHYQKCDGPEEVRTQASCIHQKNEGRPSGKVQEHIVMNYCSEEL